MSKINKILSFIVIILAILGFSTIAKAAVEVGNVYMLNYNDVHGNAKLFCVEHNQSMNGTDITYKVVTRIKIVGLKGTDQKGNTYSSRFNGRLAYILASNETKSTKQDALWYMLKNWVKDVGKDYAGMTENFIGTANEGFQQLNEDSIDYTDELVDSGISDKKDLKVTDNTNKQDIVKRDVDDNYIRIGTFNWTFPGKLTKIEVKNQSGNRISGVKFGRFIDGEFTIVGVDKIKSGGNFWVVIPKNTTASEISGITATASKKMKTATVCFLKSGTESYQNLLYGSGETENYEFNTSLDYNIKLQGSLKIQKVNKNDHKVTLEGVGFKIKNADTGKYVKRDTKNNITYVAEKDATEFSTNKDGIIEVKNLLIGKYVLYETKNPIPEYEINTQGIQVTVSGTTTTEIIENEQKWVKLSGYVWLDKQAAKQSSRNDLYKDGTNDTDDKLMENVTVRLKDRTTGKVVKSAKTKQIQSNDGIIRYYQFKEVLVKELSKYYIEFEYDGLTYTNVIPHTNKNNGSKAAENANTRDQFNKGFSTIQGASENTGVALDQSGKVAHQLNYDKNKNEHKSTLINNGLPTGQYPITANTDETGYSIKNNFKDGKTEIPYINLGLYERDQPDLTLVKDMQNVRLSINGYQHIYNYATRVDDVDDYNKSGFNVGVKFGNAYQNQKYTRPIYKADYEYINENDKSKELQVYITYRIIVKNASTNVVTQLNRLVDYFDSKYTITGIGTGIDQQGMITGNLNYKQEGYNDKYSKAIIQTNARMNPQNNTSVYVQFRLDRETVADMINNDNASLENQVEIDSYSSFDRDGKVYAGVDVNSNPGNIVPGDKTSFEDDTDASPLLKLETRDARVMTGKVFLDSTTGDLMTGQERKGSGAYEEGETGIPGVAVELTEKTGSGKVYNATTDGNGDFTIENFIPGDYELTYTWGDEKYTVQNYKGTIYDKNRYEQNSKNKEWYKVDPDTRWTDAVDDYNTRKEIDDKLTEITNTSKNNSDTYTPNKMTSTTPIMGIGVENTSTIITDSTQDKLIFNIKNIDFGIVERPRQDIALNKRVKTMKLTLANGQTLVNLTITEDGKLEGETSSVTYIPPSSTSVPQNGMVRLEMDSELIGGSKLEIGYEIEAYNRSELDYTTEDYYKYGIPGGESVTITPSAIVDYLDSDWEFTKANNNDWVAISKDDGKIILAEEVKTSNTIDNTKMLYTEAFATKELKAGEKAQIMLNVSKLLTSSQDIELDNEIEINKVTKTGGSDITSTPGNYVPGTGPAVEPDDDMAETVIITPNTGSNLNYILPIAVIVTAFVILGTGVIFIKKKVLNK